MKDFKLKATFTLHSSFKNLPDIIKVPDEWYLLLPWSWIKRKKKWKNKKRLRNKICKNHKKYINNDVLTNYILRSDEYAELSWFKSSNEIMREEDRQLVREICKTLEKK